MDPKLKKLEQVLECTAICFPIICQWTDIKQPCDGGGIEATHLILQQLMYRTNTSRQAVLMVHSYAAIHSSDIFKQTTTVSENIGHQTNSKASKISMKLSFSSGSWPMYRGQGK